MAIKSIAIAKRGTPVPQPNLAARRAEIALATRNGSQSGWAPPISRLATAKEIDMARAYYSTVLDHPADKVWSVIRPFDYYAWAGVPGQTIIEDGRKGDQVGSIRRFSNGEKSIVSARTATPFAIGRRSPCNIIRRPYALRRW